MRKGGYLLNICRLITFLYIIALPLWGIFYNAHIITELDAFTRILYFLLLIIFFNYYGQYFPTLWIIRLTCNYGLCIAGLLIFSFVTGITNYSYGEDYGFGVKSFFMAGNDLGLTMILSLIFNGLACFYSSTLFSLLRLVCVAIGCFLIGSRVGMIGCISFVLFDLFYYFIHRSHSRKDQIKKLLLFMLLIITFFWKGITVVSNIYNSFDAYTLEKFTIEGMANARTVLTNAAVEHMERFDCIGLLIGHGASTLYQDVAHNVGADTTQRAVEADYYDIIGSYGYLLGGIIILFFVSFLIIAYKRFLKNKGFGYMSLFLLFLFFIIASLFAGHAIKNVMAASLYAIGTYLVIHNKLDSHENITDK